MANDDVIDKQYLNPQCVGCASMEAQCHEAHRALRASRAREAKKNHTINFFRSVIQCGEPWTDQCQKDYDAAMAGEEK